MKARLSTRWAQRPGRWAWPLWACVVVAVVGWGFLRQEHTIDGLEVQADALAVETEQRLQDACERYNANRHDSRELMRRGDLESGEVLIEVVSAGGTTPEELAVIDAYRLLLSERQAAIVEEHAADDRDCEAERVERAREAGL